MKVYYNYCNIYKYKFNMVFILCFYYIISQQYYNISVIKQVLKIVTYTYYYLFTRLTLTY